MVARSADPKMVFLTGDLGFMALEPLREAMGARFINAGVAEQNMVSVAAGLSRQGYDVWVYSIGPFCYARPFEQIRNDLAFHNLPVRLVGNGGGYTYGVMGPTHHSIEDYGVLLCLPNMSVYVPAFDEDLEAVVIRAGSALGTSYLRLGRGETPKDYVPAPYAPWRQLTAGGGAVVIAVGPLAGSYVEAFSQISVVQRPNLWAVTEMPLERNPIPNEIWTQIASANVLCVLEEHVQRGSFGSELALAMVEQGRAVKRFVHRCARADQIDRYGSQTWLRVQSGLDPRTVIAQLGSA